MQAIEQRSKKMTASYAAVGAAVKQSFHVLMHLYSSRKSTSVQWFCHKFCISAKEADIEQKNI